MNQLHAKSVISKNEFQYFAKRNYYMSPAKNVCHKKESLYCSGEMF